MYSEITNTQVGRRMLIVVGGGGGNGNSNQSNCPVDINFESFLKGLLRPKACIVIKLLHQFSQNAYSCAQLRYKRARGASSPTANQVYRIVLYLHELLHISIAFHSHVVCGACVSGGHPLVFRYPKSASFHVQRDLLSANPIPPWRS